MGMPDQADGLGDAEQQREPDKDAEPGARDQQHPPERREFQRPQRVLHTQAGGGQKPQVRRVNWYELW